VKHGCQIVADDGLESRDGRRAMTPIDFDEVRRRVALPAFLESLGLCAARGR